MRLILAVLMFCLACPALATAGAWLRDHKAAFSAIGTTVRGNRQTAPDYETKFYLEYGLTPRVTLGFDFNDIRGKGGHALIFARIPIGSTDRRTRYAFELGVGGHHWQGEWAAMYKATVAVGRGVDSRWGNGWLALETAYEKRTGLPDPVLKLDAVAGLSSGLRLRPLLKLETAYTDGQPFAWALTPGVMFDVGKSTWVIGVERRSAQQNTIGLTFGLWRNF